MNNEMTDDRFWELVKQADWPNKDYEKVKIHYVKTLSREQSKLFRASASKFYRELDEKIEVSPFRYGLNVGDDGYNDLLYHIIGLGKEEYYKHLNNIGFVKRLGNSYGYKESFSYCIPYDGDYAEKSPYSINYVIRNAKSSIKEIDMFLKMDKGSNWLKPINKDLNYIKSIFDAFIICPKENLKELVSPVIKNDIEKIVKKIDKFFDKNYLELPRKFTNSRSDGSNFRGMCTTMFENTIDDAERVLEYMKD